MKKLTRKLIAGAALAWFTASPAFAGVLFKVDFEKTWDYANGDVNNYYAGGAAADGSTGGPNLGVSFTNVSGLSNDPLGPYYANAPSPLGVAYAHDTGAFLNYAAGFSGLLEFYYSSPLAVSGAVKVYSDVDGGGTLLGTFDISDTGGTFAGTDYNYDAWSLASVNTNGVAKSFDFTALAGIAAIDNISAIPEPGSLALLAGALGVLGLVQPRRKQQVA